MNSSRDTQRSPNVCRSDRDAIFAENAGTMYAAQCFQALRAIAMGEELLWDYKVVDPVDE